MIRQVQCIRGLRNLHAGHFNSNFKENTIEIVQLENILNSLPDKIIITSVIITQV